MNQSAIRVLAANIEHLMQPIARTLTRSVHLTAVRDGFALAMPFIFVGCLFVPILFPPISDPQSSLTQLWVNLAQTLRPTLLPSYQITMGMIGLIVAFGVSSSLAKQYRLPERLSGLTGCIAFLLLAGVYAQSDNSLYYLGGAGLFSALLVSIYSVEIVRLCFKKGWIITLPEDVPPLTSQGFKFLSPILGIMLSISGFNSYLEQEFGQNFPELIQSTLKPLVLASDSLPAVLISILICQLLWFVGIHGAMIVTGIMNPFWMANLLENQAAMELGNQSLPHIYLPAFWDFFILIGGVGSTLPLVYLALKSQSNQLRSVGKVGVIPSLFNINEPLLFGFPIIMNPLFIVPFILVPVLNATLAWFLTSAEILQRAVTMVPWSVPAPIGAAWASNGSIVNGLMVILAMFNAYFIYLPFFKTHEKILLEQEAIRQQSQHQSIE